MKKFSILAALFCVFIFIGCKKNCNQLEGEWLLKEALVDPGDGSGTFEPVSSEKTLTFSNGTVTSNGNLCDMSLETGTPTSGTYNLSDSMITAGCVYAGLPITFEQNGNELIVTYPCVEACKAKFVKQ